MKYTEIEKELPDIIEPVLLTKWSSQQVGRSKVSAMLPLMELFAAEHGLTLKRKLHYRICKGMLLDAVRKN